jgi:hypothetical protein
MTIAARAGSGSAAVTCAQSPVAGGCAGLRPQDLHAAYNIGATAPAGQTIAVVVAYDDPNAMKDLKAYDSLFHLPACTHHEHCFEEINQEGKASPLPKEVNGGWTEETSIDIDMARAICQTCHILLVEANSESIADLEAAEDAAAAQNPTEISNSWVEEEPVHATDSPAFEHKGIVITAASGDEGFLNWTGQAEQQGRPDYPASSPHVVAVGGTRLSLTEERWATETVWNGLKPGGGRGAGGSGCSESFPAPYWQLELPDWSSVGCGTDRAVADIAADADPFTGVAVYDSTPNEHGESGWAVMGGTSVSAPIVAAMFAVAGGSGGVEYPARTLYENALAKPELVHDIEGASNGACERIPTGEGTERCSVAEEGESCDEHVICVAGGGYDGPTGLGTPNGEGLLRPTGAPVKKPQMVEFTSPAPVGARVAGAAYKVSAKATSGLPAAISTLTPGVCELAGATVTFVASGPCTLEADQAGDAEYQRATPTRLTFAVGRGLQAISFESKPPGEATVAGAPYKLAAIASSGLAVSFISATTSICSVEGSLVSFTGAGTCTVVASEAGNAAYEAAPDAQQSFTVLPAPAPTQTPLVSKLPGPSSETLSSTVLTTVKPTSAFTSLAAPKVNHRTGAITFTISVQDPGTLSWLLTFRNGSFGALQATTRGCPAGQVRLRRACHPAQALFAAGRMTTTTAGTITFTAHPGRLAARALKTASASRHSLPVQASLTFQAAGGASPASRAQAVADRVGR